MFTQIKGWWERGRKYPSEDWLTAANDEVKYSPDLGDLEDKYVQFLFLPCELQSKHSQGQLTSEGGVVLWQGFTKRDFTLCRDREDNSALLLNEPKNTVKGEVWAMMPSHISKLDKYKENGVQCLRQRIDVRIPLTRFIPKNRTTKGQSEFHDLSMWAYINPIDKWLDKLDGGFRYPSVRLYRPNNPFLKPFYYYRPDEIKR